MRRHAILGMGLGVLMGIFMGGSASRAADSVEAGSTRPVRAVIELFTSQGCSSCPPADAILRTMASGDGIAALSLPVDYWDYIGWKDTFASPRNTDRQRSYAQSLGLDHVYTPQAVINGTANVVGSNKSGIERAVAETTRAFAARRVPVSYRRRGEDVVIEIGRVGGIGGPSAARIWLAPVLRKAEVAIRRGENGGRHLTYTNIVRELTALGTWQGEPLVYTLALSKAVPSGSDDSIVLVQDGETGPILGAAWLEP